MKLKRVLSMSILIGAAVSSLTFAVNAANDEIQMKSSRAVTESYAEKKSYMNSNISFTGYTSIATIRYSEIGYKYKNLKCNEDDATLHVTLSVYQESLLFPKLVEASPSSIRATGLNGTEDVWYGYTWKDVEHITYDYLSSGAGSHFNVDDFDFEWYYEIGNNNGEKIQNSYGEWIKYSQE